MLLTMAALVLPIALVVWAFIPKKQPPAEAPPELRTSLEAIVDRGLPEVKLKSPALDAKLEVVDPRKAAKLVEETATELGGTALPGEPDEEGIRLVVSLPEAQLGEFARRFGLITGSPLPVSEAGSDTIIALTFTPAAAQ